MNQNKKYTEIMKQLNYKQIGSVLLRLCDVVSSAKTCDCGSGETNFHKKIGCRECC